MVKILYWDKDLKKELDKLDKTDVYDSNTLDAEFFKNSREAMIVLRQKGKPFVESFKVMNMIINTLESQANRIGELEKLLQKYRPTNGEYQCQF
jgi:anion-transporting  ArsA/GET3 family ATPase